MDWIVELQCFFTSETSEKCETILGNPIFKIKVFNNYMPMYILKIWYCNLNFPGDARDDLTVFFFKFYHIFVGFSLF